MLDILLCYDIFYYIHLPFCDLEFLENSSKDCWKLTERFEFYLSRTCAPEGRGVEGVLRGGFGI